MDSFKSKMKTILISPKETLQEVKNNFSELFPNLKIEFFKHKHGSGDGNTKEDMITDLSLTLDQIGTIKEDLNISLDGHKKVQTLEQEFSEISVSIQLFRKSGKVWLQTTTSDNWTLAEQNKEAEKTF